MKVTPASLNPFRTGIDQKSVAKKSHQQVSAQHPEESQSNDARLRAKVSVMKIDQRDADAALGGEVHAHSSWMLPFVVLLIAGAIGAGVYVFLAGPTVEEVQGNIQGNTYSPTAASETADLRIDGALFRIPGNFTKYRRSRSAGDHEDVPMQALLPSLSPWTPDTAAQFSSNAADAKIIHFTLAVDRANLTYQDKFERGIRLNALDFAGEAGPFGLTTFKFGAGTEYANTEWFTAVLADGSLLVMRCDASANPEFGSNCMRVTRLRDNISLTYKFKRSQLASWKKSDEKLLALIESFRPRK